MRDCSASAFWDQKILRWDFKNYELIWRLGLSSIKGRQLFVQDLLRPHLTGKRVLELGCGTGRMAGAILASGASFYTGCDFSGVAARAARERLLRLGSFQDSAQIIEGNAFDLAWDSFDIVFSMGFLDWLEEDSLFELVRRHRSLNQRFVHTYSEIRRTSLFELLHRVYARIAYRSEVEGYYPRYYDSEQLRSLLSFESQRTPCIMRPREMGFGAVIHSLPVVQ